MTSIHPQISSQQLNQITETIIGCAYKVANTLGSGFLEKVYENALAHELSKNGLFVLQQHPITVRYDGVTVGDFYADLLVQQQVIVELKAQKLIGDMQLAQCLNYLKATNLRLCLLINFGPKGKVQIKRVVRNL